MDNDKNNEKVLLLDISALVYRAYFALPELTTTSGEPAGALYGFLNMLLKVLKDRRPTHVVAAIDLPGPTFRHEIYKEYKATRPKTPDDLISQLKRSSEILEAFEIPTIGIPCYEADDVIAAVVKKIRDKHPDTKIEILSGDQDLLQLVDEKTNVLAPGRGATELRVMTPKEVLKKLGVSPNRVVDYKALRGDASDNIPGIRGVGPKTAVALLDGTASLEELLLLADEPTENASKEMRRFSEKILKSRKELLLGRTLVMLRGDIDIKFALKDAELSNLPTPALTALLKRMGFETLLKRFTKGVSAQNENSREHTTLKAFISAQEKQVLGEITTREASEEFSQEIAELERGIVPIISEMERVGISVDIPTLTELSKKLTKKREALEKDIFKIVGHEFNLASPKQLSLVLYDELGIEAKKKTAGGQRSTAAAVLEELKDAHHVIKDILSWREVSKLLTTYINALPELVEKKDGRIHARFWQLGTATGRIASSDPNMQNVPVRSEEGRAVRNAFTASKGSILISADYSQIELRVVAVLAREESMLAAFAKGEDIHGVTAKRVFGVSFEGVTKEMRSRAKVLNFGILYGMGARRVSREMGVTLSEGKAFLEGYFAAFPKLKKWLNRTVEEARGCGYTETAFGRKRMFPELTSEHHGMRAAAERAAMNAPIQGTAADLMKRGMVALVRAKDAPTILVQVHDELLCEVPKDRTKEAELILHEALEGVWVDVPVEFPVKITTGERWGTMGPM